MKIKLNLICLTILNIRHKKYSCDIINDINKSKIYEHALDESIDLTLNYFNEIKNYLKEMQNKLFNINYDLTEKYYNDFQV